MLVWLNYASLIMLFGMEFTHQLHQESLEPAAATPR